MRVPWRAVGAAMLAVGCKSPTATPVVEHRSDDAAGVAVDAASATAPRMATPPVTPEAGDAFDFRVVRNLEMVPYCLVYPAALMKEDTSERWERGHRVFVSKTAARTGAKPGRLHFATSCGPTPLAQLFERDQKEIVAEAPGVVFSVKSLKDDSYVLSWKTKDRIHYGKLWVAPGDAGCFVRATFDYPESERASFDAVIPRVVAASPDCAKVIQ